MRKVLSYVLVLLSLSALDAHSQQVDYVIHARAGAEKAAASPLDALTPEQVAVVEKLNRTNASRLKRLKTVVIPATWLEDENVYSPFPQAWVWAADKPKAIVVDQAAQAFAAYEFGRLVRWGPVSTGSLGQTPSGLFHLSWRSRGHHSSIDPSWYLEWYFSFIPSRGIAFHKYSLPGRAASHGCVRMLDRDAQWLFEWGDPPRKGAAGTPVVVLGCPDRSRQWHAASYLEQGISLPDSAPSSVMNCTNYSGSTLPTQRTTIR
jgi:lipoprotein-anchoring transpeptidase ErfK/SrfK